MITQMIVYLIMISTPVTYTAQGTEYVLVAKDSVYEAAIVHIKRYEGFRSRNYLCPAGMRTIGYGIQSRTLRYISEKDADIQLRKEFNKYISYVQKHVDRSISRSSTIALALLAFNCGAGNAQRLIRRYNGHKPIYRKWLSMCHIRGTKKKNKRLQERRRYEVRLFEYGLKF